MGCSRSASIDMRISAYNIRYESKADELAGNGWAARKEPLAKLILDHKFDIIGTQEGNGKQLDELDNLLEDFDYVAHPYGGADGNLHNTATYYRKNLLFVIDEGVFWLSETPDVPSVGWDASDRRICQWIKFKDLGSGRAFYFFNAHFYFRKTEARRESAYLLVDKIREIASGDAVVLLGDFNSTPEMDQIQYLGTQLVDCLEAAEQKEGPEATFPGGRFDGEPEMRLDYIFVSKHFKVVDFKTLSDTYGSGRYPSDHLPVTSRLILE